MLTLPKVKVKAPPINWEGLPRRFVNENELETICELIRGVKPKIVIEFGINSGRTAKAILREVEGIEKYVGVDVLPGYVTAKHVQRKEIPVIAGEMVKSDPRVELIVTAKGSHELSPEQLPEADVVFIDGDHSLEGVTKDTFLARCVLREGGIVIWHDYNEVRDNRGKLAVDIAEFLHSEVENGHDIKHIEGTWLAYQIV